MTGCVTLSKLLNHSDLRDPPPWDGNNKIYLHRPGGSLENTCEGLATLSQQSNETYYGFSPVRTSVSTHAYLCPLL